MLTDFIAKTINGLASLILAHDVTLIPEYKAPPQRLALAGPVQATEVPDGHPPALQELSADGKRNPAHDRFDRAHHDIITRSWVQATAPMEQKNRGSCAVQVGTQGKWGLYTVRYPLRLMQPPTPEVMRAINANFLLALKHAIKTNDVAIVHEDGLIWVELPSPLPKPDTHISAMMQHAKKAPPLADATDELDLVGIVGLNNDGKRIVWSTAMHSVAAWIGLKGSGKTRSLQATLLTMAKENGPERVRFIVCAFKNDDWRGWESLPHVDRVVTNPAEIVNTLFEVNQEIMQRNEDGHGNKPTLMIIMDDMTNIIAHDEWPMMIKPLTSIVTGGRAMRINVAFTAHRPTEDSMGKRIFVTMSSFMVAMYTAGGSAEYKKTLGGDVDNMVPPRERGEAFLSVYSQVHGKIVTTYIKPKDDVLGILGVDGIEDVNDVGSGTNSVVDIENLGGEGGDFSTNGYAVGANPVDGQVQPSTDALQTPEFTPPVPNEVPLSKTRKQEIYNLYGYECHYCGCTDSDAKEHPIEWHVDHVVPRSYGGSNENENLVPACATCNQEKGAQTPREWFDKKLADLIEPLGPMRKNGRFYAPTNWDFLKVWYKLEVCSGNIKTIAKAIHSGDGGNQVAKVQEWADAGREVYQRIAEGQAQGIEDFLEEINRRIAENDGD